MRKKNPLITPHTHNILSFPQSCFARAGPHHPPGDDAPNARHLSTYHTVAAADCEEADRLLAAAAAAEEQGVFTGDIKVIAEEEEAHVKQMQSETSRDESTAR